MFTELNNKFKNTLSKPCLFKHVESVNMENSDFLLLRPGMTSVNLSVDMILILAEAQSSYTVKQSISNPC